MYQPVPTLVVGLGGSGSWTVVHVKQQLMDAYNNVVPSNVALVALDTLNMEQRSLPRIGSLDVLRAPGSGVGGVSLDFSEYAYVGGDAADLVIDTAETNHNPHIGAWLMADWYLRNARGVLNLDQGAGMFRQLGRLALFRDLLNPNTSKTRKVIENKFMTIGRNAGAGTSVSVMVVGSLVGGTGAGLFLDVAHIVRQIADFNNIPVVIRGFLFLPQAFRTTLNASNLEMARQRSFAAMRELQRFTLHEDYKFGYPMYYVREEAGMEKDIYRSEVRQPIYDYLYFVDGEGEHRRMNNRELKFGCAAVVADSITAFVDHHYGDVQQQITANLKTEITSRQNKTGRRAYVGSLGSYSITLPIQGIIEGWAYRLSLETIRALVPPAEVTKDKGYILSLSDRAHLQRSDLESVDETERILTTNVDIRDPHDPDGRRTFSPLPLWRHGFNYYTEMQQNRQAAISTLASNNVESWLRILTPPATEADLTIKRKLAETKSILQEQVYDGVQTSDQRKPKGNPEGDWREIIRDSERYIVRQLGQVESGGQRQGGQYGDALRQLAELQVGRFKEAMSAYIMNTLNGREAPDAITGKTGKLGWLLSVLSYMRQVFNGAYLLLEDVRTGGGNFGAITARRARMGESVEFAGRAMKEKAGEGSLVGRSTALKTQDSYLATVQEYVDFHRVEFARDEVAYTFKQFEIFLDKAIAELNVWREVLATHNASLHTLLLDGTQRIKNEKKSANEIQNHWVINDPAWEDDRYQEYLHREDAAEQYLADWMWDTSLVEDQRGEHVLGLAVRIDGQPLRRDMSGLWSSDNLDLMLDYARGRFGGALENHTILNYLMTAQSAIDPDGKRISFVDRPNLLGQYLYERSGYQLAVQLGAEELPVKVLLAWHDTTADTGQIDYLTEVIKELAARDGVGDISRGQASVFHSVKPCDDPFRLTLLSSVEAIPIDYVKAYNENRKDYMRLRWDMRQITHIFPAEVRAVRYEERLPDQLRQSRRILHDHVVVLLENQQRFRQFLTLLAYRIIRQEDERVGTELKHFWTLEMPSTDRRRQGQMEDYRLTKSEAYPPLLSAAFNYVLVKQDARTFQAGSGVDIPLPDERMVAQYLDTKRQERAAEKIERDELALNDRELRYWLEHFMPPIDEETGDEDLSNWTDDDEDAFQEVAELVVQYDTLLGMEDKLLEMLQRAAPSVRAMAQAQGDTSTAGEQTSTNVGHGDEVRIEAEYDLLSVAVIALMDMRTTLRESVERRYNRKVGEEDYLGPTNGQR